MQMHCITPTSFKSLSTNYSRDNYVIINTTGLVRKLARGVVRRCALCGGKGAFFTGWFKQTDRCKTCGFNWQRNLEGFQLGAAAMNIILTGGSLLSVMGLGVILTYPEIPIWPMLIATVGVALLVGIGGYPTSYTVWLAVDLTMNPPDESELADAATHAARSCSSIDSRT